jgi:hypothetical protein
MVNCTSIARISGTGAGTRFPDKRFPERTRSKYTKIALLPTNISGPLYCIAGDSLKIKVVFEKT